MEIVNAYELVGSYRGAARRSVAPQDSELGQVGQQRRADHRANARYTPQQVLLRAPQRAAPDCLFEFLVDTFSALAEPGNVLLDIGGYA
jgi:hypothetical protein